MAGSMGSLKTRDVVFQVELAPHMSPVIPKLVEEDWRVVITNYLKEGKLPEDPREARSCQRHARLQHQPAKLMKDIVSSCHFDQWGMDIVGPFPVAPAQKKFLLVAVDYFSNNGQVEVTNRSLLQGLKTTLGKAKGNWVDELPSVLWAYRTTRRERTKETQFSLVYGNEVVLPVEIGMESARVMFYDENNGERRFTDLDLLEEKREAATIRLEAYKIHMTQAYNHRVVQIIFKVGDFFLKKVQEEQRGKLDPK
ncbi:uncharacterized protein [Henckelia pumila]|uniref:uncharacterized protein n=1 Tax=Henckelia pumila TaxID=405737 RepID=UPI003C6E8404